MLALYLATTASATTLIASKDDQLSKAAAAAADMINKAKAEQAQADTVAGVTANKGPAASSTQKTAAAAPNTTTTAGKATLSPSVLAALALQKKLNNQKVGTAGSAAFTNRKPAINFAKNNRPPQTPGLPWPPRPPSPPAALTITSTRGRDKITPPQPHEIFPKLNMLLEACPEVPLPGEPLTSDCATVRV